LVTLVSLEFPIFQGGWKVHVEEVRNCR